MKAKELITHLEREPDADIRFSVAGEQPAAVRGVTSIENRIVLMAVPSWDFSELSAEMNRLAEAARSGLGLRTWDDVFKVTLAKDHWECRRHGRIHAECKECRALVAPGWHRGLADLSRLACNCHSQYECREAPKVEARV